jgi:hypothetical protein
MIISKKDANHCILKQLFKYTSDFKDEEESESAAI